MRKGSLRSRWYLNRLGPRARTLGVGLNNCSSWLDGKGAPQAFRPAARRGGTKIAETASSGHLIRMTLAVEGVPEPVSEQLVRPG